MPSAVWESGISFWLFGFLAFWLLVSPSFAQSFKSEANTAWHVTGDMIRAPFHRSTGDYLMAAGILSGIVLSSTLDRPAHAAALKANGSWVKTVDDIGHQLQGPAVIFGTTGAVYAYGALEHDGHARRIGWEIVESYAISATATHVVKRLAGRHRPYENDGPFDFSGFNISNNGHQSFPSGDVTVAFSFVSVLAAEARTVPTTVLFYGLGALTAFQRLNRNQHWLSDTIAGAVCGTVAGLGVVHFNRQRTASSLKLSAGMSPPGVSLTLDL